MAEVSQDIEFVRNYHELGLTNFLLDGARVSIERDYKTVGSSQSNELLVFRKKTTSTPVLPRQPPPVPSFLDMLLKISGTKSNFKTLVDGRGNKPRRPRFGNLCFLKVFILTYPSLGVVRAK